MIDAIVSQKVINGVMNRLTDIETISDYKAYIQAVRGLFDSEIGLADAAKNIIDNTLSLIGSGEMDAQILQVEVAKAINRAILTGFLSERYVRDEIMDNNTSSNNSKFIRDYETLENFMNRRIGREDMKKIAQKEAAKKEGEWQHEQANQTPS